MNALLFACLLGLPLAAHAYDEVPPSVYDAGGGQDASAPAAASATASAASTSAAAGLSASAASLSSTGRPIDMAAYTVQGRAANLVGRADSAAQGSVGQADLQERALLRPAEVLEAVPGLLITQHSGDGKANQYFTRGFNLDHGTDFAFSMDGVPANEDSNAHGQGYTDLNFLIPELVQTVNYEKGPFNVEVGDFATAGSANFVYPTALKYSIASVTAGEFGYERGLFASQLHLLGGNLIYALETDAYDGPWATPEQFKKYNGFLRWSTGPSFDQFVVSYSAYEASWYATNQMPADLIDAGSLAPNGNLAPTDGGDRDRDFLWATWTGKTGHSETDALAYLGESHLDLWNTFTFYLPYEQPGCAGCNAADDDQNVGGYTDNQQQLDNGFAQTQFANPNATGGEQFLEQDRRTREGGTLKYKDDADWFGRFKTQNEAGLDFRNDNIILGLYNTDQRVSYETDSLNHVVEASAAPYVQSATEWTSWLKSVLAFRQDFYYINVINETPAIQDGADLLTATGPAGPGGILSPLSGFNEGAGVGSDATYHATMPEPKAALILHPDGSPVEFYLNFGQGYHSNDVRELAGGVDPLARVQSEEAGARYARGNAYETTFAAWRMNMDSELTFDGDTAASITNAASTRQGLEWSNTLRAKPFYLDLDGALSQARFDSEDYLDDPLHPGFWVPEAIEQVATATFGVDKVHGWSLDLRARYFGGRALTPDDSVRSPSDTLVSCQLIRDLWAGQTLNLDVFNIFDADDPDVSYYYAYALQNSAPREAVMEHLTEPRSIRVSWNDRF